jgi:hypothetical protein
MCEALESDCFVVVGLDKGMRHGAVDRDAECPIGQHRGSAREPGDIARASGHQSSVGAVRPPQPEIDEQLARSGKHHARGFGGDQGLEMQNIYETSFDHLRLRQRRGHSQNRLIGEKHRALGHGVDVTAEPEFRKVVEECHPKAPTSRQPLDLLCREVEVFEEVERRLQPGRHQKSALSRQLAHEEFEHRGLGLAMIQIGLNHVQLVKIGE